MPQRMLNVCTLLLLLLLVACGTDEPPNVEPEKQIEVAEVDSAQPARATATAEPTNTPKPTNTRAPTNTPTASNTPPPGATRTPTPLPTDTPVPTSTPAPLELLSIELIDAEQRSRLTGEQIADEMILNRRPILCKVSNSPAVFTRPQFGLNSADLVFEHIAEGVTRFSAIFHSETPERIGPIRSARLIDTYLIPMYDTAFCFSGASIGVSQRLEGSTYRARLMRSYYDGYLRVNRGDEVPYEHTLFAEPTHFWDWLDEFEYNRNPVSETQMQFTELPPAGGESADYLRIDYRRWSKVEWLWNADIGKWTRTVDDVVATDANTNELITADNVIVLFATHFVDESICDWQLEQVAERTPDCIVGGLYPDLPDDGDLYLLRDGQKFVGRWDGDGKNQLEFFDADGEPLPLQIGNTWFQVMPYTYYESARITFERAESR